MDFLDGPGDPFATVAGGMGVDYCAMNKGVTPVFFIEPVPDPKATEESGHVTFREEERVRIIVAGDMLNQAVHPVDDGIKERFHDAYTRWKGNQKARVIDGTPIREWQLVSRAQVAELESLGVFSVENLRDMSDANVVKIADGRVWREKAKAWLDQAKDGATSTRLAADNERLRERVSDLERQIAELAAQIDEQSRRAPARSPKQAA